MNKALLQQAIDSLKFLGHSDASEVVAALKAELAKPEPEPVAYLAWRDGKPCWDGDDCVCEDAVYPVDSDDDRTSMPVYLKGTTNV